MKDAGKMALIGESQLQRNFSQRGIRLPQHFARRLYAKPLHEFADRRVMKPPENRGQMCRMDIRFGGQRRHRQLGMGCRADAAQQDDTRRHQMWRARP